MTTEAPPTLGLVLAGGLARRMGGGDKTLQEIGGVPILARVLSRFRPQCSDVILNANGDPTRFAGFGLPVVADEMADFAGPLAGVLAGLDWAAKHKPEAQWIASVPGDCPFLPRDLVARLHAARLAAKNVLACAKSGELAPPGGGALANKSARRPAPRAPRRRTAQDRSLDCPPRGGGRRMARPPGRSVLQRKPAPGSRGGGAYCGARPCRLMA